MELRRLTDRMIARQPSRLWRSVRRPLPRAAPPTFCRALPCWCTVASACTLKVPGSVLDTVQSAKAASRAECSASGLLLHDERADDFHHARPAPLQAGSKQPASLGRPSFGVGSCFRPWQLCRLGRRLHQRPEERQGPGGLIGKVIAPTALDRRHPLIADLAEDLE